MTCSSPPRDILDYLISITPICIAAVVALIAIWQSKISKNKLRLDLYNRRFDIYSRTLDFYHALLNFDGGGGSKSPERLHLYELQRNFIKSYRESRFLFDRKHGVFDILHEMNTRSFRIIGFKDHGQEIARSAPDKF